MSRDGLPQGKDLGTERRRFITAAGAGIGAALAGCIGQDGNGNGGDGNGNGEGNGSGNGDGGNGDGAGNGNNTTDGDGGDGMSDVSLEFWGIINVQSEPAREYVEEIIGDFESDTGASVDINHSGYEQLQGADWIQAFERGEAPPVFDTEPHYMGRFYEQDWITPFTDYRSELPSDILDDMEWVFETYERAMRGWDEDAYDIPWGFVPRNGLQVRADHMEEAGLDPDEDFPPEDHDDMVDFATTLQEDGPGWGFQLFGDIFDWMIPLQSWVAAEDPETAMFLNEDWTDVNFDTDAYKSVIENAVSLFQEHEVSSPETPTISDEKTTDLMIQGQVSSASVEWPNIPTFLERSGDMFESGDIRWGEAYADQMDTGVMGYYSLGLSEQPEDADEQTWERKREAGIEIISRWMSREYQAQTPDRFGFFPVNQGSWEDASIPGEENHNTLETALELGENAEAAWETHPALATIKDEIPGRAMQEIYQGADVDETMDQVAEEARNEL